MKYKILPFDSFGVNLTYECNLRCQFCVYNSNSALKGFMPLPQLEEIVDGAKDFWDRHGIDYTRPNKAWLEKKVENKRAGIHLSGGEPFLDFDYVCRAIELVSRKDVHLQFIQSNGFWVTSDEVAREKFRLLKEAGLREIFFSRTPFHAAFIPNRNIRIAIKAGEEVFGKGNVHVRELRMLEMLSEVGSEDELIPLHKFMRHFGVDSFVTLMKEYGLSHHARAATRLDLLFPKKPLEEILPENCREELLDARHCHVDPYGNYIPWTCGGISFGRLGRDIIRFFDEFDVTRFPISHALCQDRGVGRFYELAHASGFRPEPEGYINKCHLCWDMRRYIALQTDEDFPELAPREFYMVPDDYYDPEILALLKK